MSNLHGRWVAKPQHFRSQLDEYLAEPGLLQPALNHIRIDKHHRVSYIE
jgi:hypothetical protein